MGRQGLVVGVLLAALALGAVSEGSAQPSHHAQPDRRSDNGPPIPPPPPPPPPQPPPPPPADSDFVVYFGFDQAAITPQAQGVLQQTRAAVAVYETMSNAYRGVLTAYQRNYNPKAPPDTSPDVYTAKEKIVGYTDASGTADYNRALSERRAKAAADALAALGVPAANMDVSWKGKDDLAVPTGDGVKEPLNRRVTLHVGT